MECIVKNLTFKKEEDSVIVYHKLAHVTVNVKLSEDEISRLYEFINSIKPKSINESDMRVSGIGC